MIDMEVEIDYQFKTLNTNENDYYSKVQQCVKNIIIKEGYIKFNVEKNGYAGESSSFLGLLYDVNIKGETKDGEKEHNLFLKIITPGEQMTMLSLSEAYKKELFIYIELSKVFEELQNEVNLPIKDRFKMVNCYEDSTPEVLIFENMRKRGYTTTFRMDVMSREYAVLAVKELAKFHALSFVLENRRPKYYERKIKTINQPFNFKNCGMDIFAHNMCQLTLKYLNEKYKKKFEDFIPNLLEKYERFISTKCGNDVLCHGDFRPNNLLVKIMNGKIEEMITIDYQLMYHGCPVLDFMYLIFPSTDRAFRKAYLEDMKDIYHNQLRRFLKYFNLDVDVIYPREEFEAHFKERLEYGLLISVLLVPFLMAKENDLPDLTGDVAAINFTVDGKFKERINDLVVDYVEFGCL